MINRPGFLCASILLAAAVLLPPRSAIGQEEAEKTEAKPKASEKSKPAEKASKPPAQAKKKAKNGDNPLLNVLEQFLTPKDAKKKKRGAEAKPPAAIPQKPAGRNRARAGQDKSPETPLDPRFADNRVLSSNLEKARDLIEAGRWKAAIGRLQQILDTPEDSLYSDEKGRLVSIRSEAERLLGSLPDGELRSYRDAYSGAAQRLLDQALNNDDRAALATVACRYFHTDAGQEAANLLGTLHLDHGEFGLANRWFAALKEADSPICLDPRWQAKAAFLTKQLATDSEEKSSTDNTANKLNGEAQLGGVTQNVSRWLTTMATLPEPEILLKEWSQSFGTASRQGKPVGGQPLLLSRWFEPLSHSHRVRDRLQRMTEDLADDQRVMIPAISPLMVGGKIVFRTLRGVQVIDAENGKPLWETQDQVTAEQLLTGSQPSTDFVNNRFVGFRGRQIWGEERSGTSSQNPLTHLLFEDASYGNLSSDGSRLFVIEELAVLTRSYRGYWGGNSESPVDRYGQDWSSNRLTAYDLESGRPLWEVGGTDHGESFELPLAGYFIHGAPAVDAGQLFLVAEKDRRIQLFCLDAASGQVVWSQLLANSEVKIASDIARRWLGAPVSLGQGVIICPTTTGLVIALDRRTRSLLWTYDSAPKTTQSRRYGRRQNNNLLRSESLNKRWSPSPPVISGNRVVLAAPRSKYLVCLDLLSGKRIWRVVKSGETMLYLAGVHDDHAIMVGKNSVRSLNLHDQGKKKWDTPLPAPPSGRGVAVGNRFHVPLASGILLSLDLKTGEVVEEAIRPSGSRSLGNLAVNRGAVISLSPQGVEAFEQREQVALEISQLRSTNPQNSRALLKEAEIAALTGDLAETLAPLGKIDPSQLPQADNSRFHELYFSTLVSTIQSDFSQHDEAVEKLDRLIVTPEERAIFRRLIADRYAGQNKYEIAFDAYLNLADSAQDQLIQHPSNPDVSVREELWLAGRLADLWPKVPDSQREQFDSRIETSAEDISSENVSARRRWLILFEFHPAALLIQQELVEHFAQSGDLVAAENLLIRMRENPDETVAAAAVVRWAKLLFEAGIDVDAAYVLKILERDFEKTTFPDGKTGKETAATIRSAHNVEGMIGRHESISWGNRQLTTVNLARNYQDRNQITPLVGLDDEFPFFNRFHLHVRQPSERLEIVRASNNDYHALIPLRGGQNQSTGPTASFSNNHHLVVVHRNVAQSISLLERQVRWSRPISGWSRSESNSTYRSRTSDQIQPLRRISSAIRPQRSLKNQPDHIFDGRYFAYRSRRQFTVLDAQDGSLLWKLENVPSETTFFGGDGYLYRAEKGSTTGLVAMRMLDGATVDLPGLAFAARKSARFIGRNALIADSTVADAFHLSLHDPLTQRDLWHQHFPKDTVAGYVDENGLLTITPTGEFSQINLRTGAVRQLGKVDPELLKNHRIPVYAFKDNENAYLVINRSASRSSSRFNHNFSTVMISGRILAFDLNTGEQRWEYESPKGKRRNLILERLAYSPVLLLTSRKSKLISRNPNQTIQQMNVIALNKQTGEQVLDATVSNQSNLESVRVNMADKYIELRTYNSRVRLIPLQQETAAAK